MGKHAFLQNKFIDELISAVVNKFAAEFEIFNFGILKIINSPRSVTYDCG